MEIIIALRVAQTETVDNGSVQQNMRELYCAQTQTMLFDVTDVLLRYDNRCNFNYASYLMP